MSKSITEILNALGVNPADMFQEKTAAARPAAPATKTASSAQDVFVGALTKLAEEGMSVGSDAEAIEKLQAIYEQLKAEKAQKGMLDPEAEKFIEEFEAAGLSKMSSVKTAGGIQDVNNNTSNQQGMLAEQLHAADNKKNPTAANVKGDDGAGEQNPMAIGKKIEGETGKAQESSINAGGGNAKTAMERAAANVRYRAEVEKVANLVVARLQSEIKSANDEAYNVKVAQLEEIVKVAELQGRVFARSFNDELAKIQSGK